jgi:uncharacterized protein YdhG (YjbR/CyaY superfamily)
MNPPQNISIDTYIATVPTTHYASLKHLYEQIKQFYPQATEHSSHKKPFFKLDGQPLVGFYASKQHSALFVWSDLVFKMMGDQLKGYDASGSTLRFAPDQVLPDDIVKAILDARAAEIKALQD